MLAANAIVGAFGFGFAIGAKAPFLSATNTVGYTVGRAVAFRFGPTIVTCAMLVASAAPVWVAKHLRGASAGAPITARTGAGRR